MSTVPPIRGRARQPSETDEQEEPGDDETWVALLHRPGPAAAARGSLVEDPRFGEHVAFLNRMREAGFLVAAVRPWHVIMHPAVSAI